MADAIVVVSERVKDILTDVGISEKRIHAIPNAVNAHKFSSNIDGAHISAQYGLLDKIVLGFVGSFKPWHGIDKILSIADNIKQRVDNIHLILIGDNNKLNNRWKKYVSERIDWITLTGLIPHHDIPTHISIMDIAIMPNSNQYGSPMKIFEYMAMAKAVIAPKLGPLEEIIENGINGILVNPKDNNDLIEKVTLLAQDSQLRNKLGLEAQKTVLRNHTWEKNASRVIDIIEQLR